MSNRKASAKVLNVASLAAGASTLSSEFDVTSIDKVWISCIATSGGASDVVSLTPIGWIANEEWIGFPQPNIDDAGGVVFSYSNGIYTENLSRNLLTYSGSDVQYFSRSAAITGAGQPMYVGAVIASLGVTRVRLIVTNSGSNTITNIKAFCGAGGM